MKDDRLKIINKIIKLLALAGNNPNEDEAKSARQKAEKLMEQHNIKMEDIEPLINAASNSKPKQKKEEPIITEEQERNIQTCLKWLDRFKVGSMHYYEPDESGILEYLIVKEIIYSPRENAFPYSLSYFRIKFFSSGSYSNETSMTVLFSQSIIHKIKKFAMDKDTFFDYFERDLENINNKRFIITGNLLKALTKDVRAKYVTYTTNTGSINNGLLLNKNVQLLKREYPPEDFLVYLKQNRKAITINEIKFQLIGDELFVGIPRSKKLGGKYYTDKELASYTVNEQFISTSEGVNFMGSFKGNNAKYALVRFGELGLKFEIIEEVKV